MSLSASVPEADAAPVTPSVFIDTFRMIDVVLNEDRYSNEIQQMYAFIYRFFDILRKTYPDTYTMTHVKYSYSLSPDIKTMLSNAFGDFCDQPLTIPPDSNDRFFNISGGGNNCDVVMNLKVSRKNGSVELSDILFIDTGAKQFASIEGKEMLLQNLYE